MKLTLIVPCFNEEAVLPQTTARLTTVLNRLQDSQRISLGQILYVDDGSSDRTWALITQHAAQHRVFID